MKRGTVLWRRRMALLLAAALLTGETGTFASTANAAKWPQTSVASEQAAETLPVPDDYITLGDDAAPQPEQLDAAQTQEVPEGVQEEIPVFAPVSEEGEDAPVNAGDADSDHDGMPGLGLREQENGNYGEFVPEDAQGIQPETADAQGAEAPAAEVLDAAGNPDTETRAAATPVELNRQYTVSDNGIVNISYTPQEDGYYALLFSDSDTTMLNQYWVTYYAFCEDTQVSSQWMNLACPFVLSMTEGKQYNIYMSMDAFYQSVIGDSAISAQYKLIKANEDEITGGAQQVATGEVTVMKYTPQEDGQISYTYTSAGGLSYGLSCISGGRYDNRRTPTMDSGMPYYAWSVFFHKDEPLNLVFWKNSTQAQIEDTITFRSAIVPFEEVYPVDDLGKSRKIKLYDVLTAETSSALQGYQYKEVAFRFTPEEEGSYYFTSVGNNGANVSLYEKQEDGRWSYAAVEMYGQRYGQSGLVGELKAGKQYAFSWKSYVPDAQAATGEVDASVVKLEKKQVAPGASEQLAIKAGQLVSLPGEKGKFYRLSLINSDKDDSYSFDLTGGIRLTQYWNPSLTDTKGLIYYAQQDQQQLLIGKDISNGLDGTVTVTWEPYTVPAIQENEVLANSSALLPYESYVTSFTPSEDGTYSLWGISYTNTYQDVCLYAVGEDGNLAAVPDNTQNNSTMWVSPVGFSDSFDVQYDLTKDKTYYLCIMNPHNRDGAGAGDYLVSACRAKEYVYDFDTETEKTLEVDLYKSAKLQLKVPEAGFYEIETDGSAPNYYVKDSSNNTCTVYNGQSKQIYLDGQGDYVLNLAREFKKEDAVDHVKVTIKKGADLEQIPLCQSEEEEGVVVSLRESGDYRYLAFTAGEAGYYEADRRGPGATYTSVSCSYYKKDADSPVLRSVAGPIMMASGETIYIRAYTWYDGGEAEFRMRRVVEADITVGTEQTVNHNGRARLTVNIPESGIYRVTISELSELTDQEFECHSPNYSINLYGNGSRSGYLEAGSNLFDVTNYELKNSSFHIKIERQPEQLVDAEIPASRLDQTVWIKYTAEETETKLLSLTNPNKDMGVPSISMYLLQDEYLRSTSNYESGTSQDGTDYLVTDVVKDQTYFFEVNYYNSAARPEQAARVSLEAVAKASAGLGQKAELNVSKAGRLVLDQNNYAKGWYKVSVEGDASNWDVRFVWSSGRRSTSAYNVPVPGDYYFELSKKSGITVTLVNMEAEKAALGVTVSKFEPADAKEIGLREKVKKTAEFNMECYSFTAPEKGTYQLNLKGISYVSKTINGYTNTGRNRSKMTLNAGDKVLLYVVNQKGNDYSLSIGQVQKKFFFDYDEYTAFIASGGSITLQKFDDLPDGYWDDENDNWYWYDSENVIYASTKDFKNPNAKWSLVPKYSAYFSTLRTTYGDYDNDKFRPQYVQEGKVLEGLYKSAYTQEEKLLRAGSLTEAQAADPVEGPIIAVKTQPEYVLVQEITITGVNALKVGASASLRANLDTKNQYLPTNPAVEWKSSNSNVVAVDQNGTITAKSAGKAEITVTSKDPLHKSAKLEVTVVPVPDDSPKSQGGAGSQTPSVVYVQKVIISGDNELLVGATTRLAAVLDTGGQGAPSRDGVTWKTSDANIATVDADGTVTAISAGAVTITAESNDGMARADYVITVSNIVEKKIALNESAIRVKKGTSYKWLKVTFTPENTTNKTLKWTTGNKKIATANNKGVITAKGVGKTTVTVTSAGGKKATVNVTVTKDDIKTTKLSLPSKQKLYIGDRLTLVPEFTPANATNQRVKWKSSNEEVAAINAKGVVTAQKEGKATITVTSQDGSKKTAKCVITVSGLSKADGLKVSSKKNKTAELSWKEVKDADGYNIYMSTSKKGKYKMVGSTKAGVTTYTQNKLKSKKKVYFKVAAYRKAGKKSYEGSFSAVKAVKVK